MTKVIIQIPCYNEEKTLPQTLSELPRELPNVDHVEWLVIDDGSSDETASVSRSRGVDHIVRLTRNRGLAKCFITGLEASLAAGADIIVNVDADNQYCAEDIPKLIQPILEGRADIVIGSRPISEIRHFSRTKKLLQKLGSWVVRRASRTEVPDAPSGFRAFSRSAAMRLHVFDTFTYTLETLIQAGQKDMVVLSVPVRINPELRPSRLVKSIPHYMIRSILTIARIFITYKSFYFFASSGIIFLLTGILIGLRFLYYFFTGDGSGHVQSLILAALVITIGFFLIVIGFVADLVSVNRKLLEKLDWRVQNIEETYLKKRNDQL